jgi:hypothetical protein
MGLGRGVVEEDGDGGLVRLCDLGDVVAVSMYARASWMVRRMWPPFIGKR